MSGFWGNNFRLSIFGESHGEGTGIVMHGLPAGMPVDFDDLKRQMQRRAPGGQLATKRAEPDNPVFQSGLFNNHTTGAPVCVFIKNTSQRSSDYYNEDNSRIFRPGHADYTGHIKYKGYNDFRGGGHFSGRVTAGLVIAGTLARQALKFSGLSDIVIAARISRLGGVSDDPFEPDADALNRIQTADFPVFNPQTGEKMKECIIKARDEGDSVGGIIESFVLNAGEGLGEPFFNSLESVLSGLIFSIPAVKGIEFGAGFAFADMKGSEANDCIRVENDNIYHLSNNNGGINGGISNGMPLVFRAAFRPTPSIYKSQDTVKLKPNGELENVRARIRGRHDPCILPRAVPVVEAVTAIAILELFYARRMTDR